MEKKKTVMKIVCAYHKKNFGFELDMGTKDGQGVTGTTSALCPECAKIEWAKLPKGDRPPARWNPIGRFQARRRSIKEAARLRAEDAKEREDALALADLFTRDGKLHARILLMGKPFIHYLPLEVKYILEKDAADQPEIRCNMN